MRAATSLILVTPGLRLQELVEKLIKGGIRVLSVLIILNDSVLNKAPQDWPAILDLGGEVNNLLLGDSIKVVYNIAEIFVAVFLNVLKIDKNGGN